MQRSAQERWPELPLNAWMDTYTTLHLYTQVVGKIRLALAPMTNHWWQVAMYVTSRGLTTSPIPYEDRTFQLDFDFFDHQLVIMTSGGDLRRIPLGGSVKSFYREVMSKLQALGIHVHIWPLAVELPTPIRLDQDTEHASYDRVYVERFFQVLSRADTCLKAFRAGFTGKCSPVHFFWGSFDLAVTRFSGRYAPPRPNADPITRLAYDAEVSSAGFWPGGVTQAGTIVNGPAFYSYMSPMPEGFDNARVRPDRAFFDRAVGEYLLMYEDVRLASDPEGEILDFCQSTYDAGASLAGWPDFSPEWEHRHGRPVTAGHARPPAESSQPGR
jgi:hypothetical protein